MKKVLCLSFVLIVFTANVFAASFNPTTLKFSAPDAIQYGFDGSELNIPVQVSGTNALSIFCVYTKGAASEINNVMNGYLGWHHVNKVDTSVYISPSSQLTIGMNEISWDGKDDDGNIVQSGEYTYYLWGYDNISQKTTVNDIIVGKGGSGGKIAHIQEVGEDGLPLTNPVWYGKYGTEKWVIGNDPADETLLETTEYIVPAGFSSAFTLALQPDNHMNYFIRIGNGDTKEQGVQKMIWVPNGESELDTSWGEDGKVIWTGDGGGGIQPGPEIFGDYIWTGNNNYYNVIDAVSSLYEISLEDGTIEREIDMSDWWSDTNDLESGAQLNGGPNGVIKRNDFLYLNCHCSCIKQMVAPLAEDEEDFILWTNQNGDYVLDHNFEEDSARPWACNDYKVGPYTYHLAPDNNLFSNAPSYDVGAVSFGLLAPDGDGIGYFAYAGDTAGWKWFNIFVDGGSNYDGIYCDNQQSQSSDDMFKVDVPGLYYIAHDSINGTITSAPIAVEADAPEAYTVSQNSPNPFNPTTTISFAIADAGNVAIDIFNIAGQKVDTIANEYMNAGSHSVNWDASEFSAGVYFYTVKSGDFSKTLKMTLLK